MAGFGVVKDDSNNSKMPLSSEMELASNLYNMLKSNNMLAKTSRAPSMKNWAKEFVELKKFAKVNQIKHVLNWLSKHLKDEYAPKVYSAKSFRYKYDQLEEHAKNFVDLAHPYEIRPEIIKISKRLNLEWRFKEKKEELTWLQKNYEYLEALHKAMLDAYHVETNKIKELKAKSKGKYSSKDTRLQRLIWTVFSQWGGTAIMLPRWAAYVNEYATKSDHWRGSLSKYVMSDSNCEWIQRQMAQFVYEYCRDGKDFYELVWPAILKEKNKSHHGS